jgi:hypothetical protein
MTRKSQAQWTYKPQTAAQRGQLPRLAMGWGPLPLDLPCQGSSQRVVFHQLRPHERCLQVLAAVVQFDDANGIILVEQAIDALIQTAGADSVSKILALDELTEDLTVNGWNTGLAGVIREHIARQRELVIRDDRLV